MLAFRMKGRCNEYDLALLPEVDYGHAWFTLDKAVADRIKPLRRASERIENSIKFTWFSDSDDERLHCATDETGRLREGFLRAALAELVSVEECSVSIWLMSVGRIEFSG